MIKGERGAIRPLRILYAEDDAILGEIVIRLLAHHGHRAEHAADGVEAWRRLVIDARRYDVVLTDHHMPGLSGLELVARLARARFPGRIVVYSSSTTDALAADYRALGAHALVDKSSHAEELIRAVETDSDFSGPRQTPRGQAFDPIGPTADGPAHAAPQS